MDISVIGCNRSASPIATDGSNIVDENEAGRLEFFNASLSLVQAVATTGNPISQEKGRNHSCIGCAKKLPNVPFIANRVRCFVGVHWFCLESALMAPEAVKHLSKCISLSSSPYSSSPAFHSWNSISGSALQPGRQHYIPTRSCHAKLPRLPLPHIDGHPR